MPQKENISELPEWMTKRNTYIPQKDREGFLTKSILSFLKLFRHFHVEKKETVSEARAGNRILLVIGLIILLSISDNMFFCGCIAAGFLLYLCFSKTEVLKKVIVTGITSAVFTAVVMLPSYFLYKSNSVIVISAKVFLSTGMLSLFSLLTPWNKITGALRFVKIPSFIIFVLDLTIHYILILGNISYEMLVALKLRSVGKNRSKEKSFSGILGTVFLKSICYAEETQQAMECRLFDGNYIYKKAAIKIFDFIPLAVLILYIVIFIIL